jgi:hypothetical protein
VLFLTQGCPLIFNHLLGLCILEGNKEGRGGGGAARREQPTSRKLSAPATRVLQCTCLVAASRKDFSAIHTSPHLTLYVLTPNHVHNIILHLPSVLCSLYCCQCLE